MQTPSRSVASTDATTQLPLTEFFLGCVYTNDPMDRSVPPPTHGNADSVSLPQPADMATLCSPSSTSCTSDRHAGTPAPRAPPRPPPGLEKYAHLCASHGISVKAAPVQPRLHTYIHLSFAPAVTCKYHPSGKYVVCSGATYKRSASTDRVGTHNAIGADPRAGRGLFPKPRALVLPKVKFGQVKPDGLGRIDTADSDLMHHQYRLSIPQWNPGPARRNPTNIIAATCGMFHAVIFQEAIDHVPHISDQFIVYTGNTDLAIWLSPSGKTPQAKVRGTWSY